MNNLNNSETNLWITFAIAATAESKRPREPEPGGTGRQYDGGRELSEGGTRRKEGDNGSSLRSDFRFLSFFLYFLKFVNHFK